MSLATRCTTCGTVFRVVQDQLKVSEGWVRCGRCSEVFNALEGLFDLERDTPPSWPTGMLAPSTMPAMAPAVEAATDSGDAHTPVEAMSARADGESSGDAIDKIDAQLMHARESDQGSTPATRISERDRLEFPDAQFDPDMLAEDNLDLRAPAAALLIAEERAATALPAAPTAAPEFVQRAQRRARWGSPGMRAMQAAIAGVLLVALALQSMHHFRDEVVARWPETGALFASWCGVTGCTIAAPNRIQDVAVESTALTRASAPDAFRLTVVLRNRGATPVALPSVDLSLTDASGQLVARRMLVPLDFRVVAAAMRPGAESALQLILSTGSARVTGYTVEVFYP